MNTRIPARGPRERNVEVKYDNGAMIFIDCIAVETQLRRNMYERSEHLADHNRFLWGIRLPFQHLCRRSTETMAEQNRRPSETGLLFVCGQMDYSITKSGSTP